MVANLAGGQLKKNGSRLKILSRETGTAVLSRVSLLILHIQAETGAY